MNSESSFRSEFAIIVSALGNFSILSSERSGASFHITRINPHRYVCIAVVSTLVFRSGIRYQSSDVDRVFKSFSRIGNKKLSTLEPADG